jgi:alkaline phosphatase
LPRFIINSRFTPNLNTNLTSTITAAAYFECCKQHNMKRRSFFRTGAFAAAGSFLVNPFNAVGGLLSPNHSVAKRGAVKNIIFMVSDGMSAGTLNMADMYLSRKYGRSSHWLNLYRTGRGSRGLMDTGSASSLVTDSAAASSAWGGGFRVNNGALNVGPNGEQHEPVLQKFKSIGKSVGCVTTVPITHATPAGFCINIASRDDQAKIAELYLPLKFDVMMGGGNDYFSGAKRRDGKDMYQQFANNGYIVVRDRDAMLQLNSIKPVLGVFDDDGLPYTLDQNQDRHLQDTVPTLAEMTNTALIKLNQNKNGFALQVEGGKVDWAAHGNDIGGLIYDQVAFDDAIGVALDFAEKDGNTLVIMTTDHGNSNPGLFYDDTANKNFDNIQNFKHTNEWVLKQIHKDDNAARVIELIAYAQHITITTAEANDLLKYYNGVAENGLYNGANLPLRKLADIQQKYTCVGWGAMDHSADFVEVAAFGPGSELLKPFVKNTDLHGVMLQATGLA